MGSIDRLTSHSVGLTAAAAPGGDFFSSHRIEGDLLPPINGSHDPATFGPSAWESAWIDLGGEG
jgi:hypothetical protein